MKKVKLTEICNPKQWKTLATSELKDDGKYLVYGANGIIGYYDTYNHEKETVLITCRGATCGNIHISKEKSYINGNAMALDDLEEKKCLRKYLYYFLKQYDMKKIVSGSAQPQITVQSLKKVDIKLTDINTQKKIVEQLDKVQEIIDIRRKQIEELDQLIKSQFVEMFGDPIFNEKNWEEVKVIDVCDCMVPARDKPKSFTGEIPWITIEDLKVNSITYESKAKQGLTEEEINAVKRKKIPIGSVVMSCVGNLGLCSIAGKEMVINQQLHSFQCKEQINNIFLMYMIGERKYYMEKNASNTTVLYMNKSICNSIPIYLPPLLLQNQFAEIVKQIDKKKFEIQKSLEKMQKLQESLMNKYFG